MWQLCNSVGLPCYLSRDWSVIETLVISSGFPEKQVAACIVQLI